MYAIVVPPNLHEKPDIDTEILAMGPVDDVVLPDNDDYEDESDISNMDLEEGLEAGLFGDSYLESLMMDRIQNLEPSLVDNNAPLLEIDDSTISDGYEKDRRPLSNPVASFHANGGRFLTPLQEIEGSELNLTMEDHTMTKLINLCYEAGCPKYSLDNLLSTIQKEYVNGHINIKKPRKKDNLINYLRAKFKDSPPKAVLVPLPQSSIHNNNNAVISS